jgi:hypothetical protein
MAEGQVWGGAGRRPGAVPALEQLGGRGHAGRLGWLGRGHRLGRRDPGEVRLEEGPVEDLHGVGFPDQALGLVRAERRFQAPQVHPDAVRLGRLDRGHHVLVAGHQHRVGDGPMPGQGFHVRADLRVHALLLAARVQVAEPQLHPGHLGDHPLVDGGHPVPGRVIPVDPEQFAADQAVGMPGERLDQLVRVDPVLPPGADAEQEFARRGVDITDINHDRVTRERGQRRDDVGHGIHDSTAGPALPGAEAEPELIAV